MTVAIVIGALFGISLVVWLSGYYFMSGGSPLRWIPSIFVLTSLFLLLFIYFFVKPDVGKIDILIDKGIVSDIKQLELEIPFDPKNYKQKNGYLVLNDEKNREYTVKLPNQGNGTLKKLRIHTSNNFLFSLKYLMVKIKKKYIIITFGSLFAFIMSFGAVLFVWFSGTDGEISILTPSD